MRGIEQSLTTLPEKPFRRSAGLFSGSRIGKGQVSYPYSPDVYPKEQGQLYERIGLYDWIGGTILGGQGISKRIVEAIQRDDKLRLYIKSNLKVCMIYPFGFVITKQYSSCYPFGYKEWSIVYKMQLFQVFSYQKECNVYTFGCLSLSKGVPAWATGGYYVYIHTQ